MALPEHVRRLYAHYAEGADACVVEGMMGLFDGYERDRGSSAEIAALLGLPVVLVVDARSAAYSIAALLNGFRHFRPDTHIAGVLFNKVGSSRHADMLREACADAGLPCFGCLPKDEALEQKSRYLGLDFSQERVGFSADELAERMERHIDIPRLLQAVTRSLDEAESPFGKPPSGHLHTVVYAMPNPFPSFMRNISTSCGAWGGSLSSIRRKTYRCLKIPTCSTCPEAIRRSMPCASHSHRDQRHAGRTQCRDRYRPLPLAGSASVAIPPERHPARTTGHHEPHRYPRRKDQSQASPRHRTDPSL